MMRSYPPCDDVSRARSVTDLPSKATDTDRSGKRVDRNYVKPVSGVIHIAKCVPLVLLNPTIPPLTGSHVVPLRAFLDQPLAGLIAHIGTIPPSGEFCC